MSMIGVGACRQEPELETLKTIISADPLPERDYLFELCRKSGSPATNVIEQALLKAEDSHRRVLLVTCLLVIDTNRFLPLAIDLLARTNVVGLSDVTSVLTGAMDDKSREILDQAVRTSRGYQLIAALRLFDLVCDNTESLATMKWLLEERVLPPEELVPALSVLGNAAYYNADQSSLDYIVPFLEHERSDVRLVSVMALRGVPGDKARTVLIQAVATSKTRYVEGFQSLLLEEREKALRTTVRRAPGWKRAVD
jgi:hypothetical protein